MPDLVSSLPSSNPILRVKSAIQVEVDKHRISRSRSRSRWFGLGWKPSAKGGGEGLLGLGPSLGGG